MSREQHPGRHKLPLHQVRRLVAIDGPNQGIINCSPSPLNYFQLPAAGGFTPNSEVCQELGSPNAPFLKLLNRDGDAHGDRDRGRFGQAKVRTLVIRNADKSFVFFPVQDGAIAPVPAEDSFGKPTDFSRSASIKGAEQLDLVGQGVYDPILGTTHLGILNSPQTSPGDVRLPHRAAAAALRCRVECRGLRRP